MEMTKPTNKRQKYKIHGQAGRLFRAAGARAVAFLAVGALAACLLLTLAPDNAFSQENNTSGNYYEIRDGRMYIIIDKHTDKTTLEQFLDRYDLSDLGLIRVLSSGNLDKLKKMGWRVDTDNSRKLVISKVIGGIDQLGNPEKRMALTEAHPNTYDLFPSQNDDLVYGFNRFSGKFPFAVQDSLVTFFLKGHTGARQVLLAGSFTNWQNGALTMTRTDSGWTRVVKLNPGKYWYKFIINGGWTPDPDNKLNETDHRGNTNSVYYKPNTVFSLPGYNSARDAYLTGSFNDWNPGELPMEKGPFGWMIHLYLAEGTYAYKFVVDGKWQEDPANPHQVPDGHKGFNSVYRLGKPHLFALKGYPSAKSVVLTGSFNGWKTYDLLMHKTAEGWELPYTLGPGNYEYRFLVDGKWINDPANPLFLYNRDARTVNSFLIIQPNYTFRLEGYANAKTICLAGDFNDWTPDALKMERVGDTWVFHVHLSVGKHLYKFIVDGRWIKDPANPLWEENDNSVIWMEER
jgi:Glycogen recognition site of AMP-activated protein kinase